MSKPDRVVVPGLPHHITHRGNRREEIFREADDYQTYLRLLRKAIERHSVLLWSYSLMANHVHLVAVPERQESLGKALHWAHGNYAGYFNARYDTVGHLWEGRFRSSVMDEHHLFNGIRYVERNPVRARLVLRAEDYPWSSPAARCGLRGDALISDDLPLLLEIQDWSNWLAGVESEEELRRIRQCADRGYPVGSEEFIRRIEQESGYCFPSPKKGTRGQPPRPLW